MTCHQKRTVAVVPTLALLSTMAVCDGQPLAVARPIPPRRSGPVGLAAHPAPQLRPLAAPYAVLVLPAATNFTEVDGQKTVLRSLLFTPEDARRTRTRSLLFTPEDMQRTVWRFAAAQPARKPLAAPGKPAGLQQPRR
jgi:hypothetical protein